MEYSNIIIAFVSVISVVITMSKILGKKFDKIDECFKEIRVDIREIRVDIHKLDKKITRIEDRLEFSNKIVYVQHEDLKEN